jgi:hypothetical protein
MNEKMPAERLWVLIEGPAPGDAEFLGRWLLAAANADGMLQERFKHNPGLKDEIDSLEAVSDISFSLTAAKFVELLMKNLACFTLALWDEWGQDFPVMAELGFFRLTGDRYQMTIPQEISGAMIETALLKLADTEDEECYLHPEHFVSCLEKTDADRWQRRLERLPQLQRAADRALLLEEIGHRPS